MHFEVIFPLFRLFFQLLPWEIYDACLKWKVSQRNGPFLIFTVHSACGQRLPAPFGICRRSTLTLSCTPSAEADGSRSRYQEPLPTYLVSVTSAFLSLIYLFLTRICQITLRGKSFYSALTAAGYSTETFV